MNEITLRKHFTMKRLFLTLVFVSLSTFVASADDRPNVLFIAVDDLNHWIGHLGRNSQAKTPNIDRLAAMAQPLPMLTRPSLPANHRVAP